MANWTCDLCRETGTDLGSYVALTARRRAHLKCYRDELAEQVIVKYEQDKREAAADLARAEADRAKAQEEAALAGLLALRAKGKDLWTRDVTITTGLVDTHTIPQLMKLVASGRLDPTVFATHHFALEDTMSAYDTFADAANTAALKVVLEGSEVRGGPEPAIAVAALA